MRHIRRGRRNRKRRHDYADQTFRLATQETRGERGAKRRPGDGARPAPAPPRSCAHPTSSGAPGAPTAASSSTGRKTNGLGPPVATKNSSTNCSEESDGVSVGTRERSAESVPGTLSGGDPKRGSQAGEGRWSVCHDAPAPWVPDDLVKAWGSSAGPYLRVDSRADRAA